MYAIILAGGSGTRLWPLSRELYPKQFMPAPGRAGDNDQVSLFQATIRRVAASVPEEKIIVVTHVDQAGEIRRQLDQVNFSAVRLLEEPQARNTAPAIGLAAWFVRHEAGPEAVMAVLPSDHLIPESDQFTLLLERGRDAAGAFGLVTFGIRPTYPETGYGYICCGDRLEGETLKVDKFVEKPDLERARAYLDDPRYLWNSGMFVFRVGALIEQYQKLLPAMHASLEKLGWSPLTGLAEIYGGLEKISIDYGILERAPGVAVIPATLAWSDLGSWEAYHQAAPLDGRGNYFKGPVYAVDSADSLILASGRPLGAIGLKDMVVVDTADALLVCHRRQTQDVRRVVDALREEGAVEAREHRTVYRPWGSYTSLEMGAAYQVKRINVNPGARLSLQSHRRRAENWVVVAGEALVTIDDQSITVKKGQSAFIPTGARHRMENRGRDPLVIIEVQNGDYLGEDDIERYEDDYGRAAPETAPPPGTRSGQNSGKPGSAAKVEPGALENGPDPGPVSGPARARFSQWLNEPALDPLIKEEIRAMAQDPLRVENHFGSELSFGTGGMRGLIGPGLNRINSYTIRRATQGLADYLNGLPLKAGSAGPHRVVIAHDTRRFSDQFAAEAALVLAANGIKALLFNGIRPTPMLSFATRELGCSAGIVITASHNPPDYNGFKVYGPDGGQAVSPLVDELIEAIGRVDIFGGVKTTTRREAYAGGLLEEVDPALDRFYLEKVSALSLSSPAACLKVVYTPLHGTGAVYIPNLLAQSSCLELVTVEEQMDPDPRFSTVRVPNPEDPAALEMALEKARLTGADLVLATDPDGDRVGTAVRASDGSYVILNGNQVGALLIEYICSHMVAEGIMPPAPTLVKTIVTGDLGRKVAHSYGLRTVETLTGFKFIGAEIEEFSRKGGADFVFGYEESCGYLAGTFVRDKDAVIASLLIAEMAAFYRDSGRDLLQVIDELQQRHGYHAEELLTVELKNIAEADRYVAAFHDLPAQVGGMAVLEKKDYEKGRGLELATGRRFDLGLPRSPVLHYSLAGGSWFAVRPSGTEPKVKFYLAVVAPDAAAAEGKLARLREEVRNLASSTD